MSNLEAEATHKTSLPLDTSFFPHLIEDLAPFLCTDVA
jgi:hypothetical protein